MKKEAIKIMFIAFPDGSCIWFNTSRVDKDKDYPRKCMDAWESTLTAEHRTRMMEVNVMPVAGTLTMLVSDYYKIPATNFPWPE